MREVVRGRVGNDVVGEVLGEHAVEVVVVRSVSGRVVEDVVAMLNALGVCAGIWQKWSTSAIVLYTNKGEKWTICAISNSSDWLIFGKGGLLISRLQQRSLYALFVGN